MKGSFVPILGLALLTLFMPRGTVRNTAVVSINTNAIGERIPDDFLGFSFEKSVLAEDHFDPANSELVNLLDNLGKGVLRIGGNEVEYTYWSRDEKQVASTGSTSARKAKKGERVTLGPAALDKFYAFAKASGWRVIHGLNLGANDPAMAADEAAYAWKVGGPSVLAFEVGNEPNLYDRNGVRPAKYTYELYHNELSHSYSAILTALPGAPLAGPATTKTSKWIPDYVKDFKAAQVTSHIYPLSAKEPDKQSPRFASLGNLLSGKADQVWYAATAENQKAAAAAGMPLRLDECNSASGGGSQGVSDVFASALWCVDFAFNMAERGVVGINFHGSFYGGGSYSPIRKVEGHYQPQPLYYGMLLFHQAAQGRLLGVDCRTRENLAAHAVLSNDGKVRVVLINKELDKSVTVSIVAGPNRNKAELLRLMAPSVMSRDGIALAGKSVAADGKWAPGAGERVQSHAGKFYVVLPAASAVMLVVE